MLIKEVAIHAAEVIPSGVKGFAYVSVARDSYRGCADSFLASRLVDRKPFASYACLCRLVEHLCYHYSDNCWISHNRRCYSDYWLHSAETYLTQDAIQLTGVCYVEPSKKST